MLRMKSFAFLFCAVGFNDADPQSISREQQSSTPIYLYCAFSLPLLIFHCILVSFGLSLMTTGLTPPKMLMEIRE